jgi:hypothetical protein
MNRAWRVAVLVAPAFACIPNPSNNPSVGGANDYVGGLVFAGTGVAATAVNRKITGDCYANCQAGYACDRDSGLCERIECSCPADQVCEIVGGRKVCTQRRRPPEEPLDAGADAPEADGSAK